MFKLEYLELARNLAVKLVVWFLKSIIDGKIDDAEKRELVMLIITSLAQAGLPADAKLFHLEEEE